MLISVLFLNSCIKPEIKVALSKGKGSEHYDNYGKWLNEINPDIEYVDLYHLNRAEALKILEDCSGLVLTGGPDVHPDRYGKGFDTARCEIDLKRDTLEFELIKLAKKLKIPVLAICRGEQILNVAEGGSLIVDIPSDFDTLVQHQCKETSNCFHKVMIVKNTLLSDITGLQFGEVNSNHHQGVHKLADIFIASAFSQDGLIEAYELKDKKNKPFLLAVQWHPERLDKSNKLSSAIGEKFLMEVKKFYEKK
jgi:putative glutamine amidotransferase